jgi:predicted PurR-regulated permease PerM
MMPSDRDVFVERVLIVLGLVTLFAVAGLLAWAATEVLLLAFAGLLLAVFLRGLADLLGRATGLSAGWSLTVVVIALGALIGAGGWFLASEVADQFQQLSESLTTSAENLREHLRGHPWGRRVLDGASGPELIAGRADVLGRVTGVVSSTLGFAANVLVIVFVGLYVAADPATYRDGAIRLVPPRWRGRAGEVLDAADVRLRWWLIGRLLSMAVVGGATTAGLALLGVPMALALGLLAFVMDFVPYIGPWVAAVPALLVASTISPMTTVYVAALYLVIQGLEGYVLAPLVEGGAANLPPALTILALVLLGLLAGVLGVALATPLTVVFLVAAQKLYVQDTLGDRTG